jgi:nitroimidazol reductase NimA-like FMN-containing flavoprotein (pyridoxamine 5'-phosphate oxidase superfamily)
MNPIPAKREETGVMKEEPGISLQVRRLLGAQRFAVLSTHDGSQAYCSLVAFTVSDDLAHVYFATKRCTTKYRNAAAHGKVAMLIDNRLNSADDVTAAMALTVLGTATELTGSPRERAADLYVRKHAYLERFLRDKDTAMMDISVNRYSLATFDSVRNVRLGG